MDYKPGDVYVGVTDLFAVLLPGAIVTALLAARVDVSAFSLVVPLDTPAKQWAAFAISSYLFGHLLFMLGATLDAPVYDPIRRYFVPTDKDDVYNRAAEIHDQLGGVSGFNTYQWARAALRLRSPAATADVDRHEADSKFFRSLFVLMYGIAILVTAIAIGDCGHRGWCRGLRVGATVVSSLLPLSVVALSIFGRFTAEKPEPKWLMRAFAGISVIVLLLSAATAAWVSVATFALAFLCLWRYAERRWKSSKLAYQYVIVWAYLAVRIGESEGVSSVARSDE